MKQPLNVFIGYDSREPLSYHVAAHSILTRSHAPLSITPLNLHSLSNCYFRERGATESTEFSMTRFLVPYLSNYDRYSLFIDCDILCQTNLCDIALYPLLDPGKAVYVVKHDYTPKSTTKMEGLTQTSYPKKNWSSVMLFNNRFCKTLTPDYVSKATGLDLHRFNWIREDQVGALPKEWNWLVDEYEHNDDAKLYHYTLGGPWFKSLRECDHADIWIKEYKAMRGDTAHLDMAPSSAVSRSTCPAPSTHAEGKCSGYCYSGEEPL